MQNIYRVRAAKASTLAGLTIAGALLSSVARSRAQGVPPAQSKSKVTTKLEVAAKMEIPRPAPQIAAGAWRAVLTSQHPRLLGPRGHLRALAASKPDAFNEVKSDDSVRDSMMAAGIAHAVEGLKPEQIAPYVETAMRNAERGPTNVHQDSWIWMQEVVLAYDFFHEQLTPPQREKMIAWLNVQLESFTDDENAFHNSTMSKILTYLRVAYATWEENPKAQAFRDHAIIKLYEGRVLPVLREFGAGGGTTEAGWYARGALWNLVQALELARRVEGYDGFQKAPRFFYQRLAYEMFQPYPGLWIYGAERYPVEGDGSDLYGGHSEYSRHIRTVLAQYFRGSELARYAMNRRARGSNGAARMVNFLFEEEPDARLPLDNFPLAHLQSGVGIVYARSDWTDDATWFRFNCGDYWAGHQHFDVGNFEIFRREPLATESGEYVSYGSNHSVNWLMRTIAHNAILIHQPDEKWPLRGDTMRDGGRVRYANDGGQNKIWEWPVATLDEWKARREQFERGDIIAYENQPQFMFVAGDCTRAYAPSKLRSWVRQIVFLRPHTFIIFDRVISTQPQYQKTWLLHSRNEPALQNQALQNQTATITNGTGKLTVQTLLPEGARVRTVRDYAYGGQTFDEEKSGLSETANLWRMEVSPTGARNEDIFLHVLSTEDKPQPARLVRQGNHVGARIGGTTIFFDGPIGGTLTLAGKPFFLQAGLKTGRYE